MRKLVVTEFITLDGVIEAPHHWSFDYWHDEIGNFKDRELQESDAMLLGRVTYEGFAAAWPERKDEDGYADRMNNYPKYVPTSTLDEASWNNTILIKDNLAGDVAKLKQQDGQNILIHGSGKLVNSLLAEDLIDEFHLLVFPIVLGKGQRLFEREHNSKLTLVESVTYPTGVVGLTYTRAA